jgi:hypothetical protein
MSPLCGVGQGSVDVDVQPDPGSTFTSGRPAALPTVELKTPAAATNPFSSNTIAWAPSSLPFLIHSLFPQIGQTWLRLEGWTSSLVVSAVVLFPQTIPADHRFPVGTMGRSNRRRCGTTPEDAAPATPLVPGRPFGATE